MLTNKAQNAQTVQTLQTNLGFVYLCSLESLFVFCEFCVIWVFKRFVLCVRRGGCNLCFERDLGFVFCDLYFKS